MLYQERENPCEYMNMDFLPLIYVGPVSQKHNLNNYKIPCIFECCEVFTFIRTLFQIIKGQQEMFVVTSLVCSNAFAPGN